MTITASSLPFAYDELEPFISKESLQQHYDEHYLESVHEFNRTVKGTPFSSMSLRDIVLASDGEIFDKAAQIWNHAFYWQCLTSDRGSQPAGVLLSSIESTFGSFNRFHSEFERYGRNNLGSGWTWLVKTSTGKLSIVNTPNAGTPIVDINTVPLLVIDLWEHAYYRDYKRRRSKYLEQFWEFVNWSFVEENFIGIGV